VFCFIIFDRQTVLYFYKPSICNKYPCTVLFFSPKISPNNTDFFIHHQVIYVDEDGRPITPPPASDRPQRSDRPSSHKDSLKDVRTDNIDTRHLYAVSRPNTSPLMLFFMPPKGGI